MIGTNKEIAYNDAKKCLDQLLANDQIPFYGYVEIMLQLDAMKREERAPTAKWIDDLEGTKNYNQYFGICSCCQQIDERLNFCGHCGAKMEVNKDE